MALTHVRLALSGSGFLAPIHAGAICAFMDSGVQIVEVAGTSGGSIAAALVASGKTSAQIRDIALAPIPAGIMRFQPWSLLRKGINDGGVMHRWLQDTIGAATLEQASVPCTIIATDIDAGAPAVFTRESAPSLALADACRASASVPGVWVPFDINGRPHADGGMVDNLPANRLAVDNIPRIGIDVQDGSTAGSSATLLGYVKQCLGTMLASSEVNVMSWAKATGATIIPVTATPYGFLDAKLPDTARADLFSRGYNAVRAAIA